MDLQEEIMVMVSNIDDEKVLRLIYSIIKHLASSESLQEMLGKIDPAG